MSFNGLPKDIKKIIFEEIESDCSVNTNYSNAMMRLVCKDWCNLLEPYTVSQYGYKALNEMLLYLAQHHIDIFRYYMFTFKWIYSDILDNKKQIASLLAKYHPTEYGCFCKFACVQYDIQDVAIIPRRWWPLFKEGFCATEEIRRNVLKGCVGNYELTKWVLTTSIYHVSIFTTDFVIKILCNNADTNADAFECRLDWYLHFFEPSKHNLRMLQVKLLRDDNLNALYMFISKTKFCECSLFNSQHQHEYFKDICGCNIPNKRRKILEK